MNANQYYERMCVSWGGGFVFPIKCHTTKATFFSLQKKVVCLSQCDLWFAKILKRSFNKSSDYVLLFIPMAVCVFGEVCCNLTITFLQPYTYTPY